MPSPTMPMLLDKSGDDCLVGRGEKKISHLGNVHPSYIVVIMKADMAPKQNGPDGDEPNDLSAAVIVNRLGDHVASLDMDVHLFMELTRRALAGRLSGFDLSSGKFPVSSERDLGLPARDEDMTLAVFYNGCGDVNHKHEYIPHRAGLSKNR